MVFVMIFVLVLVLSQKSCTSSQEGIVCTAVTTMQQIDSQQMAAPLKIVETRSQVLLACCSLPSSRHCLSLVNQLAYWSLYILVQDTSYLTSGLLRESMNPLIFRVRSVKISVTGIRDKRLGGWLLNEVSIRSNE